jgi:sugar phosphate isomerase/epimerase
MLRQPLAIGVCSWSLQVKSVAELRALLDELRVNVVQIACGDPHHAAWDEGDRFPNVARGAGFDMTGAMLGFPGEDYTTPQTIQKTGGFSDPATRMERLERLRWGVDRTAALGLCDLMLHAGFIPEENEADRLPFLKTLESASDIAAKHEITIAFETGQETAEHLNRTLEQLDRPNMGVNFDPANMLLYDKGDPIAAVELLGARIRSVHVKDAFRPTVPGAWGREVPIGQGEVHMQTFIDTLRKVDYRGPLCIEREVGTQTQRVSDIAHAIDLLNSLIS